eukprot:scaffold184574_cov57-Attheya_sp.AAC.1
MSDARMESSHVCDAATVAKSTPTGFHISWGTCVTIVATLYLLRSIWISTPDWIKRWFSITSTSRHDPSLHPEKDTNILVREDDPNNNNKTGITVIQNQPTTRVDLMMDWGDPVTVLAKIKEIMALLDRKWSEVESQMYNPSNSSHSPTQETSTEGDSSSHSLPPLKAYCAIVCLIRLEAKLRRCHPSIRRQDMQLASNHDPNHKGSTDPPVDEEEESSSSSLECLQELAFYMDCADWAYDESFPVLRTKLMGVGMTLLRHDIASEPGRVGHYIAMDHKKKIAVIGLKGTSTFGDVLTDLVGTAAPHTLHHSFLNTTTLSDDDDDNDNNNDNHDELEIRCHEGIFTAACTVADETQDVVEHLFLPAGYQIVLTGHSLGAGTAALVGVLLRSRIAALRLDDDTHNNEDSTTTTTIPRLRVFAFASPPVMDLDTAIACKPFITTIVNNSDVVPRLSMGNMIHQYKLVVRVCDRMEQEGFFPNDIQSLYTLFSVSSSSSSSSPSSTNIMPQDICDRIMSLEEYTNMRNELHTLQDLKEADNLYVPGRVICMYEKDPIVATTIESTTKPGPPPNNSPIGILGATTGVDETELFQKEIGMVVTDGSIQSLRQFDMVPTFVTDHLTEPYKKSLSTLIHQETMSSNKNERINKIPPSMHTNQ